VFNFTRENSKFYICIGIKESSVIMTGEPVHTISKGLTYHTINLHKDTPPTIEIIKAPLSFVFSHFQPITYASLQTNNSTNTSSITPITTNNVYDFLYKHHISSEEIICIS